MFCVDASERIDKIAFNCQDVSGFFHQNNKWYHISDGDGGNMLIDEFDPDFMYYFDYQGSLYRLHGFDLSASNPIYFLNNLYFFPPMVKHPSDKNRLYFGTDHLYYFEDIFKENQLEEIHVSSLDNTTYINCGSIQKVHTHKLTDIEISHNNPDVMYVSTKQTYWSLSYDADCNTGNDLDPDYFETALFKSINGGQSWTDISAGLLGLFSGFITDIELNPYSDNEFWLTFGHATTDEGHPNRTRKVYHSTNGGTSYTVFDQGINPKIPVWRLKFDPLTRNLYMATDVGVFKRHINASQWENLSITTDGGVLHKMVYDLDIHNKSRTLYAATFGKGLWLAPLNDCPEYSSTPLIVHGNQTWSAPKHIASDVIVETGSTLTITDIVFFNGNSKLIIERGAKLYIDGGVLTNSCDSDTWQGIEVWGNSAQGQNPSYQGMLEITNGGTIENAITGVLLDKGGSGNAPQGYTGGIIIADNAVFKNNLNDIIFNPYIQPTISYLSSCRFITDENSPHQGAITQAHLTMTDYRELQIHGCTFANENTEILPATQKGTGIFSSNSSFFIDHLCITGPPCMEYQPTVFDKLYYGIYALGTTSERTFTVQNSDFSCYRGIYNSAFDNSTFALNDFYVPATEAGIDEAYGLYLDNSTGYTVESNFFNGVTGEEQVGLYVNNSGEYDNLIYNNTFKQLYYAINIQGINRHDYGGLLVKCNDYIQNITDLTVVTEGGPLQHIHEGIAQSQGYIPLPPNQGDPTAPAGNTFTNYYAHVWDIYNESNSIVYIFHNESSTNKRVNPTENYGSVSTNENLDAQYDKDIACPSSFGDGEGRDGLMGTMLAAESSADSTSAELTALTDGGDTDELAFDVAMAMPGEEIETRDILLAQSPDLSDTVMVAAIEKEDVLPNAMVRDVLVENPQAAKSKKVQDALDNRDEEMPQYMRHQIDQGYDTLSEKELLEAKLAYHKSKKSWAFNKLHYLYRTDTAVINVYDSLEQLYTINSNLSNQYRLAMLKLENGDTTEPYTILSDIQNNYELTDDQENERLAYNSYFNIIKQMIKEEQMYPDSTAISNLTNVEQDGHGKPSVYARNVLIMAGEITFNESILLPDTSLKADKITDPSLINIVQSNGPTMLILKPNPANDYVIAEWSLPELSGEPILIISSLDGHIVNKIKLDGLRNEKVISTSRLKPGSYLFTIRDNQTIFESKKLTIIK